METSDRRIRLPPSLRKELHPVQEEVAWARGLSPEERLAVTAALCQDAMILLAINPKRDRVLALRDAIPESTRLALARLRNGLAR